MDNEDDVGGTVGDGVVVVRVALVRAGSGRSLHLRGHPWPTVEADLHLSEWLQLNRSYQ